MIELDLTSRTPVYQQIKERITELIMMDVYEQDTRLPSVRSLATELGINPNTIQKAYQELENENVIYTVGGKGCFAGKKQDAQRIVQEHIMQNLRDLLRTARLSGVTEEQLRQMAEEVYKEGSIQ